MAYNELVKDFSRIRDYMREFLYTDLKVAKKSALRVRGAMITGVAG
jgi:hypothetical protein